MTTQRRVITTAAEDSSDTERDCERRRGLTQKEQKDRRVGERRSKRKKAETKNRLEDVRRRRKDTPTEERKLQTGR